MCKGGGVVAFYFFNNLANSTCGELPMWLGGRLADVGLECCRFVVLYVQKTYNKDARLLSCKENNNFDPLFVLKSSKEISK